MVEIQSASQTSAVNTFIQANGNGGFFWNGLQRPTPGFKTIKIIFISISHKTKGYILLVHSAHYSMSSNVLGENSQNFLRKYIIFFCNFKVLLHSSYSYKISIL